MAIFYGRKSTKITNSLVDSVVTTGSPTVITNGDVNGFYEYKATINTTGCGNPDTTIFIKLKDTIPWTAMTCYFEMDGVASCWTFNQSGGNMQNYSESAGDRIFNDVNAFSSNANFVKQLTACDNEPTNFFHGSYATGGSNSVKSFWLTSRRIQNGSLSGPYHYRSCNDSGRYIYIKDIFIF